MGQWASLDCNAIEMTQPVVLPAALEDVKIVSLPSNAYYIAHFISQEEEAELLNKIASAPKPRWKQLTHRRLQTWPSELTKDTLLDSTLPQWLQEPIISRILKLPVTLNNPNNHIFDASPHHGPNHVLINEYLPGQGIMPHKDGAAYHPVVCTVSLGGSLCLDIYGNEHGARDSQSRWKILQEPRSLLITTDAMYTDHLHGIADVLEDSDLNPATVANWSLLGSPSDFGCGRIERQVRTSCTFRDVLKVSKIGNKFGFLGRR